MATAFPSASDEIAPLVPRPGWVVWDYGGDARLMLASGYALGLQVCHPTVAAGVREHSDYASDPFGRLLRTLDYLYVMTYGGPEAAAATARRLREMHKKIKGVAPNGSRYHALEPEAFAWVHATLLEGTVVAHRRFARPLSPEQIERLYSEWLGLGRLIGVREGDLPDNWASFRDYFDAMVKDRLEDSDVVHGVIESLQQPARPPLPFLRDSAWRVLRVPPARLFSLATVGLLPPLLRQRLGMRWTRRQDLELRVLGRMSRAATPLMPARLRNVGPYYLRWRREQLARGEDVAMVPDPDTFAPA